MLCDLWLTLCQSLKRMGLGCSMLYKFQAVFSLPQEVIPGLPNMCITLVLGDSEVTKR